MSLTQKDLQSIRTVVLDVVSNEVVKIERRFTILEEKFDKRFTLLEKRFDEVETRLTILEQRMEKLESDVEIVKLKLEKIENDLESFKTYMEQRFDSMTTVVSETFQEFKTRIKLNENRIQNLYLKVEDTQIE